MQQAVEATTTEERERKKERKRKKARFLKHEFSSKPTLILNFEIRFQLFFPLLLSTLCSTIKRNVSFSIFLDFRYKREKKMKTDINITFDLSEIFH